MKKVLLKFTKFGPKSNNLKKNALEKKSLKFNFEKSNYDVTILIWYKTYRMFISKYALSRAWVTLYMEFNISFTDN